MSCASWWKCCVINIQVDNNDSFDQKVSKRCRVYLTNLCKWIPVVFVWALFIWSYYVYVCLECIGLITTTKEKVVYLVIYHFIMLMFLWSYIRTMFSNNIIVPSKFHLSDEHMSKLLVCRVRAERQKLMEDVINSTPGLMINTVSQQGELRYCQRCRCLKPDRSHHCSLCQTCVLKMDHHCPWVNNCVGFYNYKYFLLMLIYVSMMGVFVGGTTIQLTVLIYTRTVELESVLDVTAINILILQFISLIVSLITISLLLYHICLIRKNKTTLETIQPPKFNKTVTAASYDWGWRTNFLQVFGEDPLKWSIPIFSSLGDGVTFLTRENTQKQRTNSYDATGTTCMKEVK